VSPSTILETSATNSAIGECYPSYIISISLLDIILNSSFSAMASVHT
jgi:hypothetical protein